MGGGQQIPQENPEDPEDYSSLVRNRGSGIWVEVTHSTPCCTAHPVAQPSPTDQAAQRIFSLPVLEAGSPRWRLEPPRDELPWASLLRPHLGVCVHQIIQDCLILRSLSEFHPQRPIIHTRSPFELPGGHIWGATVQPPMLAKCVLCFLAVNASREKPQHA